MIHKIRIQNFKSLRDVAVDLSPVTVFIGKSGTGKTNLTSAIRFLRDCLASKDGGVWRDYAAWQCATNPAEPAQFQVVFSVPGFPDAFCYTLGLNRHAGAPQPEIESLEYGNRTIFRQRESNHQQMRWEVEPALVVPPEAGAIVLGRLPALEEAVVAYTVLTAGIAVHNFPYDVLGQGVQRQGTFGQRDSSETISGLADTGENFLDVMVAIRNSFQPDTRRGIVATLQRINPTVASVEIDSVQNPQTAIVGHRLGDKILPLGLHQESDGFRRFYAHLLALYQTPPKQTLVFEEPENGIYPGALSLLAEEFNAAPEAGRGQVLLTTHSPSLLDHFSADQIRVVELVDLETHVGILEEKQRQSLAEELLHAGELLTVDPARRQ